MALLFFALTLFVSAFLLFLVQPIIGKMILPKLGGTPQVWNTCMVFFQTALLAGYFYTHAATTYLSTRKQIIVHCCLLLLPFLILLPWGPFNVVAWVPPSGGNPVFATLVLLAIIVGIPFFVVATSAPLLQKWFASTGHPASKDPYFLYGASNLGSMLSLLAYPILVEPWFHLQAPVHGGVAGFDFMTQSWLWTVGYIILVALIVGCALLALKAPPSVLLAGGHRGPGQLEASAAVEAPPPGPEMAAGEKPVIEPGGETAAPPPAPDGAAAAPAATATAVTASAPPAAPASAAPPPKPGPSMAIKKGSKQKKHQKHKHPHREQPKQETHREAFAQPAVAAALKTTAAPAAHVPHAPIARPQDEMTPGRRLRWIGLAAVPSSFMLGVTTHMSTDISAIPLFWVIPLALYLLSFILVFMRWPVTWIGQPHLAAVIVQPVLLAALVILPTVTSVHEVVWLIAINLLAFFSTALVCHGELAKDRPSTKHLTEFYLWMSVGGMLGGMFNGLLAPVLFPGLWEFSIAIMLAGFLRPALREYGWVDQLIAMVTSDGGAHHAAKRGHVRSIRRESDLPSPTLTLTLDIVIPIAILILALVLQAVSRNGFIAYGVPLALACACLDRPVRFGLALAFLVVLIDMREGGRRESLLTQRSYFGILNVRRGADFYLEGNQEHVYYYTNLTHGTTDHGQNFLKPEGSQWYGDKTRNKLDLSRLATTYYHRTGPVGMAMERFDWFVKLGNSAPEVAKFWNTYTSDTRLPASVVGSALAPLGGALNPALAQMPAVIGCYSEPPYATIGLGTGTMASYARPFQHMHFYEIDERVRRYSLPDREGDEPYFTYLRDALNRGALVNVLMGDARLRMGEPWIADKHEGKKPWEIPWGDRGGPDSFYHLIVVDAFSSDAIPVHLLTRESVKTYLRKLAPGGVLCIHTSNRHLDLVPVVADVAASIYTDKVTGKLLPDSTPAEREAAKKTGRPLVAKRGRDNAPGHSRLPGSNTLVLANKEHMGHTTSEWVIVARKQEDLDGDPNDKNDLRGLKVPADYTDLRNLYNQKVAQYGVRPNTESYWSTPPSTGRYVWTDDYSNMLAVFRPFMKHSE